MLRHERREEDVIRRTKSYRLDQGEYHGQRSCMTTGGKWQGGEDDISVENHLVRRRAALKEPKA